MSLEYTALIVIAASAFVYIGLERVFPYDKQRVFREGWFTDFVWYTLIQSYVLKFVIAWIIESVDNTTGLSRLQLVSGWPMWLQLVFFTFLHDLYIYWFHRWQHSNRLLWRLHEAHHSVKDVDWLAGSRSHALEILINQTIEFMPMLLLGAAPEVVIYKGLVDAVWGMYIHSNLDVRTGWLQKVINGPEMHRWHHSRDVHDINFSTKFAFWDWIFQTAFLPPRKPSGYGLADVAFPRSYFVQQAFAFRRFTPHEAVTDETHAGAMDRQADRPAAVEAPLHGDHGGAASGAGSGPGCITPGA